MNKLTGKGASFGMAEGVISFYRKEKEVLDEKTTYRAQEEEKALFSAVERVKDILAAEEEIAEKTIGKEEAEVFMIHRMMLEDADFLSAMREKIALGHSAAYAADSAAKSLADRLVETGDAYMKERAADLLEVGERLVFSIVGKNRSVLPRGARDIILCAEDLAPGETLHLDKSQIAGFVLSRGSTQSHTAILARSMGIPALVGVGEVLFSLDEGERVLLDAEAGELVFCPEEDECRQFFEKKAEMEKEKSLWEKARGRELISKNGHRTEVYGNIGSAEEAERVMADDGDGVGLFRSEFLYLGKTSAPSEDEQFAAYRKALEACEGKRVVIRTLDIGADKKVPYMALDGEANPALGLRGIRLCLQRSLLFRAQLRALLRASVYGKLAILLPMVTSVEEIRRAKAMLFEESEALKENGIPIAEKIELGIMIETPAAAVCSDLFAKEVDFFSVGTNDLTQYALALDRENEAVAFCFHPHHEAVLRLIAMAADNAHQNGIWIGICGELAADRALTERFLEMEIDELSVAPSMILPLKAHILSLCEGKALTASLPE